MGKVWYCKVGSSEEVDLKWGADFPMRQAVREAYFKLTGEYPEFISSGWAPLLPDAAEEREYKALLARRAKALEIQLTDGTRVRLKSPPPGDELVVGDKGTVEAAWTRAAVSIRWDKDGKLRTVNRKRLELVQGE